MEKKKKKPRLKTKLQKLGIIASLVAILVSSVLCIPSSAVGEDIIGMWVVNDDIPVPRDDISANFEGVAHWVKSDGTVSEFVITNAIIIETGFRFTLNGEENGTARRVDFYNNNCFMYPSLHIGKGESNYIVARTFTIETVPDNQEFIDYILANATKYELPPEPTEPPPPPPPEPTTIIDDILKPFTEVGAWIATFVTALLGIFYNVELGKLTFCGVLSIAVLGFAVMFLLIRVIENFTHFRS